MRIRRTVNQCQLCGETIGSRPTLHPCLANGRAAAAPTQQRHQCPKCQQSFTTKKGLHNHLMWHTKEEAKAAREAATQQPSSPTHSQPTTSTPVVPRTAEPRAETPARDTTVSREPAPSDQIQMATPEATNTNQDVSGTTSQETNLDSFGGDVPVASSQTAEDGPENNTQEGPETSPAREVINDKRVLADHTRRLRQLRTEPASPEAWDQFTSILNDAIDVAARTVKLPEATPEGGSRREVNAENPKQIQALYRRNRRRAVRLIVEGPSSLCPIPIATVEAHFTATWAAREADTSIFRHRSQASSEVSLAAFTADEVLARLQKCENTAPGTDRLTYQHWRTVDPEGAFLAAVFNLCLHHRRVPDTWRASKTVLIHKKGSKDEPGNWRPIALGCTIAKLYAGCLAARMQQWLCDEEVLCRCQKGFLPHDGVFEHNFVLQERLDAARTSGGDLCVAFLDFANAFGSVAHNALVEAARSAGAGDTFSEIIRDLYRSNTTSILVEEGLTAPIHLAAGIRQGCPLSGLLFNLVIDPVVRAVQGGGRRHAVLAYADDLTPLADDPDTLQSRINTVATLAARLGLHLNPAKCRSLHLSGKTPVGTRPTSFHIGGQPIPHIDDFASHDFLGRPVGYRVLTEEATIDDAITLGKRLLTSMLAPWQRIDAVKTFLFPALNFVMRAGTLGKEQWKRLDDALRPLLKRTLYLPGNAANGYLYGSTKAGAVGIPIAAETSDACRVDNAFKLLSSTDMEVRDLALQAVTEVVSKRLRRPASTDDIGAYLSGETEGDFRATSTQLSSVWTEARKASRRLGVTWVLEADGAHITCGSINLSPRNRRKVIKTLRTIQTAARDTELQAAPNQGKVMECVAADPASSHFMRVGRYTRFADWRFMHKARLNLLPLNGARPWAQAADQRCRRCGYQQETLPHVLCHCMRQSRALTDRHNAIVNRVKTAAMGRFTITHEDRPVGTSTLRPDLVLARGEEAIILDVTVPFENRRSALLEARQKKIEKYQPIRDYLQQRYQRVTVDAIVVGALGSWDPANDKVLRRLCSRSYLRIMKRLIVSETIAASRDIYAEHVTGKH